jgi:hypothetical protein
LTGARVDGEIEIRQHTVLDPPVRSLVHLYPPVTPEHIAEAARLGEQLCAISFAESPGSYWRLFRTLRVYMEARTRDEVIDRIHQYCRCIDGLINSEPGKSKRQFKSRTELFIGPEHHGMMGEIYDVRSAVEHLHEYEYLEEFNREVRLDLVKKEAIVEWIARSALARMIAQEALWKHFANTPALTEFWALPPDKRQEIWGAPVDSQAALSGFEPQYINDGELGAPAD